MIHRTVEEIMEMPGYCRDDYERQIKKLEGKLKAVEKRLNEFEDDDTSAYQLRDSLKCIICHIDICIQGRVPTKECFSQEEMKK